MCLALALFICAGTVQAKETVVEEDQVLPITTALIVEMPDGSMEKILLPTEEPKVGVVTPKSIPTAGLPPIILWQPGWFWFQGIPILGFVGPDSYVFVGLFINEVFCFWSYNPATASWVYVPGGFFKNRSS